MQNQKKLILVILLAQLVGCESSLVGWPETETETETETNGTSPTVNSVTPVDGAVDVATNTSISAIFSEKMDAATISTTTFTLHDGATPVPGTVNLAGATATFTPTDSLDSETEYTAIITSEAADLAGNTLAEDYVWTFVAADTVPSYDPLHGPSGWGH